MAFPNVIAALVSQLEGKKYRPAPSQTERQVLRETLTLLKPAADGAASTTTAYTAAHHITMPRACKVLGAIVNPQGALTADATNNATIKVVKGDGAGGAETICASAVTTAGGTGNWVAGAKEPLTLSATVADTRIAKGGVLGFSIAKGGTGVAVPISSITVDVEWEDIDDYTTTS